MRFVVLVFFMLNFFLLLLCRHEVHVNGKLAKGAAVVLFVRGSNPGSLFWGFLFRWCLVLFFLLLLWLKILFSALRGVGFMSNFFLLLLCPH